MPGCNTLLACRAQLYEYSLWPLRCIFRGMDTQNSQVRRLIFWNRFWLVLAVLYALYVGIDFLYERLTYDVVRLHLDWGREDLVEKELGLVLSMNQGGPFVITHLVRQRIGNQDLAVATLPKPFLIYRHKSRIYIRSSELAKFVWINEEGKKVSPPKSGQPVTALHYKLLGITTKATAAN